MPAKKTKKRVKPLAELLASDRKKKIALKKQFVEFEDVVKKVLKGHSRLAQLEIPLRKLRDAVQDAAHGELPCEVLVEYEEGHW
jgi:hypothetical protein